jgi:hypothetical protein
MTYKPNLIVRKNPFCFGPHDDRPPAAPSVKEGQLTEESLKVSHHEDEVDHWG